MPKERKPLNLAERTVVTAMQQWPTLFRDADDFYNSCIVGDQGRHYWQNGLLVTDEQEYKGTVNEVPQWGPYPLRISEELAQDLMYYCNRMFHSVHPMQLKNYPSPIDLMPDDLHPDWQKFIGMRLWSDKKISLEFYHTLAEAYCICQYGMRDNPNASIKRYEEEWEIYWKRIPSYEARLEVIRITQENGKIPAWTYQGMCI